MDIRTKYITPAIVKAEWDYFSQMREEYPITKGRIIARGKTCKREKPLQADYVLFYKPNKPIAIIEAKDNNHSIGDGMQQALNYAKEIRAALRDKEKYSDWANSAQIKELMQADIIIILAKHGYPPTPPEVYEKVYNDVIEQAENFKKYSD